MQQQIETPIFFVCDDLLAPTFIISNMKKKKKITDWESIKMTAATNM